MENSAGKKILYVEDDKSAQDVVKRILIDLYQVDTCEDAVAALAKLNAERYDGILLDINLRYGINGIQLFELIREINEYKNIPVIAMTAYAAESDRRDLLSKGFTGYLAKPFTIKGLVEITEKIFK
jgi:CheY-like chemotaxis protein